LANYIIFSVKTGERIRPWINILKLGNAAKTLEYLMH